MNSLLIKNLPPILDFEASSLSDCSYPISAGLVVNGEVHYWIIKPEPSWIDWSLPSQALHGLSRSFIEARGLPTKQVYEEMLVVLNDRNYVYSDNPYWEALWFSRLGSVPFEFRDIKELLPPEKVKFFQQSRQLVFERDGLAPHRADHDALATALTITKLRMNS